MAQAGFGFDDVDVVEGLAPGAVAAVGAGQVGPPAVLCGVGHAPAGRHEQRGLAAVAGAVDRPGRCWQQGLQILQQALRKAGLAEAGHHAGQGAADRGGAGRPGSCGGEGSHCLMVRVLCRGRCCHLQG